MCRQNQLRGMVLLGIGLGLLVGCCLESGFWCCLLGIGALTGGLLHILKK